MDGEEQNQGLEGEGDETAIWETGGRLEGMVFCHEVREISYVRCCCKVLLCHDL